MDGAKGEEGQDHVEQVRNVGSEILNLRERKKQEEAQVSSLHRHFVRVYADSGGIERMRRLAKHSWNRDHNG